LNTGPLALPGVGEDADGRSPALHSAYLRPENPEGGRPNIPSITSD
jgi:hypothetical protein